ncbi:MAG: hypothetical protein N3D20_03265, partial [Candidatus Pacearchaeota archaeon]|nr:hypothetical protein [Candidatus Pacearchaeota archaeon]
MTITTNEETRLMPPLTYYNDETQKLPTLPKTRNKIKRIERLEKTLESINNSPERYHPKINEYTKRLEKELRDSRTPKEYSQSTFGSIAHS